jgi:hypothetical protein
VKSSTSISQNKTLERIRKNSLEAQREHSSTYEEKENQYTRTYNKRKYTRPSMTRESKKIYTEGETILPEIKGRTISMTTII